ncbi:MAG: hypothetical protein U0271_30145 [Polyangiaceae bacterium]
MPISDDQLKASLNSGVLTYLRAFLSQPDDAVLAVAPTPTQVLGTLTIASADFAKVDADSNLRSHFSRTFNTLSRFLDGTRGAAFTIRKAP